MSGPSDGVSEMLVEEIKQYLTSDKARALFDAGIPVIVIVQADPGEPGSVESHTCDGCRRVVKALRIWSTAWERRVVDGTLVYYSVPFPPGTTPTDVVLIKPERPRIVFVRWLCEACADEMEAHPPVL